MSGTSSKSLIQLLIDQQVLKFGDFTLKSGRRSPYFFNLGELCTGAAMAQLAAAYADAMEAANLRPDVLFGPAYKGIPLAVAVATTLAARGRDLGFAFNRKERKGHGEGGHLVGAALQGRKVLLLDDVLTAGTALREAVDLVQAAGGEIVGVVIAMDRQERPPGDDDMASANPAAEGSAVSALATKLQVPVLSLINLTDLVRFLDSASQDSDAVLEIGGRNLGNLKQRMMDYQSQYCVATR